MDSTMCFDVWKNSLDENNRKYVPDEVFETLEEATEVVDSIIESYNSEDGPFIYAVIRNSDKANIGYVQLVKILEGWEIGYHIAQLYCGHGYATEAVSLFINYLKHEGRVNELYGIALANNKASRRVLEKNGFELIFEGKGIYQGKPRKIIKTIYYLQGKRILETERLILREKNDDDFAALKKIIHDKPNGECSDEYARRWLNWCKDSYKKNGFGLWAVILKETGEMIGTCGVSMQYIDDEWKPEIGYHLRKDYHRQGLGKEVTKAIKDYFFTHFDFDEVYSYMNKDNIASYKTAEANGMKYLHLYTTKSGEECRVYRITREEWIKERTHFKNFEASDYEKVINFLVELNKDNSKHINWNWARFEWMYEHPEFNKDLQNTIGLWFDDDHLVGVAIYDMYFGEASCLYLPHYESLFPEIVDYAYKNIKDENGLGIAINENDNNDIEKLKEVGFELSEQKETILSLPLIKKLEVKLSEGFNICEVDQDKDVKDISWLFWQGFDHGNDKKEFEEQFEYEPHIRPHFNKHLSIGIKDDDGELVSICGVWFLKNTDYAYIEPVCTVPSYRGKGLAKAAIFEALNRAKKLGAKKAYVISDMEFYKKLGFSQEQLYHFYWKR